MQRYWDNLDATAEREATAIRNMRFYSSRKPHFGGGGISMKLGDFPSKKAIRPQKPFNPPESLTFKRLSKSKIRRMALRGGVEMPEIQINMGDL